MQSGGAAPWLLDELDFLEAQDRSLEVVLGTLQQCDELANELTQSLDGFQHKLDKLRDNMGPVYRKASELKIINDNTSAAIEGVSSIISSIEIADSVQSKKMSLHGSGLHDYLQWVREVETAIAFFEEHRRFKNARNYLNKLGEHRSRAIRDLTRLCEQIMNEHVKCISGKALDFPFSQDVSILPPAAANTFQKVAPLLVSMMGGTQFLDFLKAPLSGFVTASMDLAAERLPRALPSEDRPYVRGSSPLAFWLQALLRVLQLLREMLSEVLQNCSVNAGSPSFAAFLQTLFSQPLEVFLKRCSVFLKRKKLPHKVLCFLDSLLELNGLLSGFRSVLRQTDLFLRFLSLREQLETALKQAVDELREQIVSLSSGGASLGSFAALGSGNGTIHSLTVDCFKFLRALEDFQESFDDQEEDEHEGQGQELELELETSAGELLQDRNSNLLDSPVFSSRATGLGRRGERRRRETEEEKEEERFEPSQLLMTGTRHSRLPLSQNLNQNLNQNLKQNQVALPLANTSLRKIRPSVLRRNSRSELTGTETLLDSSSRSHPLLSNPLHSNPLHSHHHSLPQTHSQQGSGHVAEEYSAWDQKKWTRLRVNTYQLTRWNMGILDALERSLLNISKAFKDGPVSVVFLLNNYDYILRQVRLGLNVTNNYAESLERQIKQYRENYLTASWGALLRPEAALDIEHARKLKAACAGLKPPLPRKVRDPIKAKFGAFNETLTKQLEKQRAISVPEPELKARLLNENQALVVSRFTELYQLFLGVNFTSNPHKYHKYTPQSVEVLLKKFFSEQD